MFNQLLIAVLLECGFQHMLRRGHDIDRRYWASANADLWS